MRRDPDVLVELKWLFNRSILNNDLRRSRLPNREKYFYTTCSSFALKYSCVQLAVVLDQIASSEYLFILMNFSDQGHRKNMAKFY